MDGKSNFRVWVCVKVGFALRRNLQNLHAKSLAARSRVAEVELRLTEYLAILRCYILLLRAQTSCLSS